MNLTVQKNLNVFKCNQLSYNAVNFIYKPQRIKLGYDNNKILKYVSIKLQDQAFSL